MIDVILTAEEQKKAISFGKAIYQNKLNKGTAKAPVDTSRKLYVLDIISTASEMAVCKFLGIPYKFELFDVKDEQDVIVKDLTCDVKCGKPMNTELKVQKWHVETKEFGAYIGVNQAKVGSVAKFYIAGWITQEDFKKIARLKTYRGYEDYPMYVVHYSALKTIAELAFLQELP